MGSKSQWIQGAVKHPGALTRAASKAHKSVAAFAKEHAHDSGVLGKRARFAETMRALARKRKRS